MINKIINFLNYPIYEIPCNCPDYIYIYEIIILLITMLIIMIGSRYLQKMVNKYYNPIVMAYEIPVKDNYKKN